MRPLVHHGFANEDGPVVKDKGIRAADFGARTFPHPMAVYPDPPLHSRKCPCPQISTSLLGAPARLRAKDARVGQANVLTPMPGAQR